VTRSEPKTRDRLSVFGGAEAAPKRNRNTKTAPGKQDPVIETHACPGSSIVCRPLGNLDWPPPSGYATSSLSRSNPGVEIVIDLSRVRSIDAVGMNAVVGSIRLAGRSEEQPGYATPA
jgi:hypothetical protein